ncbi:MAG: DUF3098 domain-containing protein [Muribaculaceae bacterium]|nr:DUF3098 domain-containing protein [Muribaculaceae bacterium]
MAQKTSYTTSRLSSQAEGQSLDKETESQRPLVKTNFILMAIAGAMIIIGFLLMTGASNDAGTFNADIFSARRVVIGPTIAFLGFIFMGVGIMYNPRSRRHGND